MKNLDIILPCKQCRDNISLNFHFFQVMNLEVPGWFYILTELFSPLHAKNNKKEVNEIQSKVNQKLGTRLSISDLLTADASSLPRMWSPQPEFQEDMSPGNVQPTACPWRSPAGRCAYSHSARWASRKTVMSPWWQLKEQKISILEILIFTEPGVS